MMPKFEYHSMERKLLNFGFRHSGMKFFLNGSKIGMDLPHAIHYIESNFATVIFNLDNDKLNALRDWCQEQFGDAWIYSYSTFSFKNPRDATHAALVWAASSDRNS
jgi:uncharacterized protein YycO